jgi:hypothetical protein
MFAARLAALANLPIENQRPQIGNQGEQQWFPIFVRHGTNMETYI